MGGKRESVTRRCLRVNDIVPGEKMKDFDLDSDELRFYFRLHNYRFWTTTQMVKETGVGRVTVYRYIKKLEDGGLLEVKSGLGPKQKRSLMWRRKYDEVRISGWRVCWVKPVRKR